MDNFDEAKAIKPYLRFRVGAVVYLTSDTKKRCPMSVTNYLVSDDHVDYALRWTNSQNTMEVDFLPDSALNS